MEQIRIFSNIRFPLIVLVIFIHVYAALNHVLSLETYSITPIMEWVSLILSRAAVPFFFLISGFFFFYGVDKFDKICYVGKLKRRIKTLFIPYITWNTIFILLYAVKGREVGIRDYWDANGGEPICYPFWFIRDLMVVCVSTPIIYWTIKKTKIIAIPCIIVWFLMGGGFSESLAFFTAGATMSIHHIEIRITKKSAYIMVIGALSISFLLTNIAMSNHFVLYALVLVLMTGFYAVMCCLPDSFTMPQYYPNSVLFVLGFSTLLIMVFVTLMKECAKCSSLTLFLSYLLIGIFSTVISVFGFLLISRFFNYHYIVTGKIISEKKHK